jgi:hypothetical protein
MWNSGGNEVGRRRATTRPDNSTPPGRTAPHVAQGEKRGIFFIDLMEKKNLLFSPSVTADQVTCTYCMSPCDMRFKFKFKHCEQIWKKSCMFTAHIKITPKNFRSKFETYIEKKKRNLSWIVPEFKSEFLCRLFTSEFLFFVSRCIFRILIWNF